MKYEIIFENRKIKTNEILLQKNDTVRRICTLLHSRRSKELYVQGAAFNVTHFESRVTHLLYTAINTTEHG